MQSKVQEMPEQGNSAVLSGREWAKGKTLFSFLTLIVSANVLGMINLPVMLGFKIHTFQYAVFMAGIFYGPVGGALAGGFGSFSSAFSMGNPYLIIGNTLLGLAAGFLMAKKVGIIASALLAFALQAVWIWISDVYFLSMPEFRVATILLALLISNLIWAIAVKFTYTKFSRLLP